MEQSGAFTALSSIAFGMVFTLVLATPFIEMTGVLTSDQKIWRIYAYGLLSVTQITLAIFRGWKRSLQVLNTPVLFFLSWCVLSLSWTQDLELTAKRLILLIIVYCAIFSGVCDIGAKRSINLMRSILVAILVMNFIVVFSVPEIGRHVAPAIGLWRGLMANKNIAGMLCAITIIMFVFDSVKVPSAIRVSVICASLVFFYEAWSKTTWISLPIALASGASILILQRYQSSLLVSRRYIVRGTQILTATFVLVLLIATLQQDAFLSLTEDTTAVTMRAAIWRPMIQFYLAHPVLGSGYGSYWDPATNLLAPTAAKAGIWKDVDQGHNGYLDLLVQIGLPGLALALYAAIVWPISELSSIMARQPRRTALIVSLVVFVLIENLSESSLFADDSIGNGILLVALAQVHRIVLRSELRKRISYRARRALSPADLR